MPTASTTASGPRPSVRSTSSAHQVLRQVERLDAVLRPQVAADLLGVDGEHAVAEVLADAGGELADRAEAEHGERAALGHVGVLHGLPRGRQDVAEEQPAVVGGAVVRHRRWGRSRRAARAGTRPGRRGPGRTSSCSRRARRRVPYSVTWVVSHCDCRPRWHMKQWPQEMLKGTTTRSPTFRFVTRGCRPPRRCPSARGRGRRPCRCTGRARGTGAGRSRRSPWR